MRVPEAVGTSIFAAAAEEPAAEEEVEADDAEEAEVDAEVEAAEEAEVEAAAEEDSAVAVEAGAEEDEAASSPPPPQAVRARAATDRTAAERPKRRAFTEVPLSWWVTVPAGLPDPESLLCRGR